MSKIFLDTNVPVYALDRDQPAKQARARELLAHFADADTSVVSTQVLQEAFVAAVGKLGIEAVQAKAFLRSLPVHETVTVTPEMVFSAMDCSVLNQLSFWDALIVTTAAAAACTCIWTEDFNDGQVIMGVRIENPFR
jgi:predicted nucleic acid-binding protein